MPWRVRGQVELRFEFVRRARGGERISSLCRDYGVSRTTGYLWLKRFKESGTIQSLTDKSHRPESCPHRTKESVELEVIALREKYGWGADKLRVLLLQKGIDVPRATINRIIRRNGLLIEEDCHRPAVKQFERERSNELWQVDLKGCMGRGNARCEPLSMLDDHSRYLVGLYPTRSSKLEPIQAAFQKTFEKYGVPSELLMDHGVPWWANATVTGFSRLSVWLMKQDIKLRFSGYGHPQTQGKVERFHRTLANTVRHKGTPQAFNEWSKLLSTIREEYNHIRPHASLGLAVPASRYSPSNKIFNPSPEPPRYPAGSTIIKLDSFGRFSYNGIRLYASEALAHEHIRLETLENTALIYYRNTPVRECSLITGKSVQFSTSA